MKNKINIKLVYGTLTKTNFLYIYINNCPIFITNIHFYDITFHYYKNMSEITLWNEKNKIICSIERNNINHIINKIPKYENEINKFKISF